MPQVQGIDLLGILNAASQFGYLKMQQEKYKHDLQAERQDQEQKRKVRDLTMKFMNEVDPEKKDALRIELSSYAPTLVSKIEQDETNRAKSAIEIQTKQREIAQKTTATTAKAMDDFLAGLEGNMSPININQGIMRLANMSNNGLISTTPQELAQFRQSLLNGDLNPQAKQWQAMRANWQQTNNEFGTKEKRERFSQKIEDQARIGANMLTQRGIKDPNIFNPSWQQQNYPDTWVKAGEEQQRQAIALKKAGASTINTGEVTKGTRTKLETSVQANREILDNLAEIKRIYKPEMLEWWNRKISEGVPLVEMLAGQEKIPDEYKEMVSNFKTLQDLIGRNMSAYRRTVTGAAASEQELKRLEREFPNINLSATQFEASVEALIAQSKRNLQRDINTYKHGVDLSNPYENQTPVKRQPEIKTQPRAIKQTMSLNEIKQALQEGRITKEQANTMIDDWQKSRLL